MLYVSVCAYMHMQSRITSHQVQVRRLPLQDVELRRNCIVAKRVPPAGQHVEYDHAGHLHVRLGFPASLCRRSERGQHLMTMAMVLVSRLSASPGMSHWRLMPHW